MEGETDDSVVYKIPSLTLSSYSILTENYKYYPTKLSNDCFDLTMYSKMEASSKF